MADQSNQSNQSNQSKERLSKEVIRLRQELYNKITTRVI
jgi:hypothetical protein